MSAAEMKRMGIDSASRTPATVEGYELRFEKRASNNHQKGFANITVSDTRSVHGILYDVADEDMGIIDKRENEYTKKEVIATLKNGEKVKALAYVANPDVIFEDLLPSREYIQLICESEDLLPEDYLKAIRVLNTLEENL